MQILYDHSECFELRRCLWKSLFALVLREKVTKCVFLVWLLLLRQYRMNSLDCFAPLYMIHFININIAHCSLPCYHFRLSLFILFPHLLDFSLKYLNLFIEPIFIVSSWMRFLLELLNFMSKKLTFLSVFIHTALKIICIHLFNNRWHILVNITPCLI